jgi:hypothetical protein
MACADPRLCRSRSVMPAISRTAASNAGWLAFDGLWKPLTLRTNCRAAAEISSDVTRASLRRRTLMLRHISGRIILHFGNSEAEAQFAGDLEPAIACISRVGEEPMWRSPQPEVSESGRGPLRQIPQNSRPTHGAHSDRLPGTGARRCIFRTTRLRLLRTRSVRGRAAR